MARAATAGVAAPARRAPARRPAPVRPARPARRGAPSRRPGAGTARTALGARALGRVGDLLQGPLLIGVVFVLLAGVVFANVTLLERNRQIAHASERATSIKHENARLRAEVARLGSSERIQQVAAERGLVLPAPGEVRYLGSNPAVDARNASEMIDASAVPEAATP